MATLDSYYNAAFSANKDGNIYKPFTTFERLSHERRIALLDKLPLPTLSGATVVDFGVGAWGIGCVFPKLKLADVLYGLDISEHALQLTERVHASDPSMIGKDIRLLRSDGCKLDIPDNSVDLFFAGEAIEHIDLTEPFLEEVYRVLRKGGRAIFTTPNATPFIYRSFGMRWCVGFEHSALMDYQTLATLFEKYFTIEIAKGYNQSFHPSVDQSFNETDAFAWVHASEDDPLNATGLVFMLKKNDHRVFRRRTVSVIEGINCLSKGPFRDMVLTPGCAGRLVDLEGGRLIIPVPSGASQAALIFWSHDWSGIACAELNGRSYELDLYHPIGGAHRLMLGLRGEEFITVHALEHRNQRSLGNEVILARVTFCT